MLDNPTFEEVKELMQLAADKTDLKIIFVDEHSSKASYCTGEITIASSDSLRVYVQ